MAAKSKARARKDGAAIPLDELDKKLLNLMQGSFPLAPRPYEHVAGLAEVPEAEVLNVQALLRSAIILVASTSIRCGIMCRRSAGTSASSRRRI